MKILVMTLALLSTSAFSAETPKGLGQFDPTQCGCETCFTKYGHCTAVDQSPKNQIKSISNSKSTTGKKKASKVDGV